jgi:hypothetical protein
MNSVNNEMLLCTDEAGESCDLFADDVLCSATKSILRNFSATSSTFGAPHKLKISQAFLAINQIFTMHRWLLFREQLADGNRLGLPMLDFLHRAFLPADPAHRLRHRPPSVVNHVRHSY